MIAGLEITGRSKNWEGLRQNIDFDRFAHLINQEIAGSIFVKLQKRPTSQVKIQLMLSVKDTSDTSFYLTLAQRLVNPNDATSWTEISGSTMAMKDGLNWEKTKQISFYIQVDDPTMGYVADTGRDQNVLNVPNF